MKASDFDGTLGSMTDWKDAVLSAVRRQAALSADGFFTRRRLIKEELQRIVTDVDSAGATPKQTLSRELQELAETGVLAFVNNRGTYRLLAEGEQAGAFDVVARYDIDGFRSLNSFCVSLKVGLNALVGPNGAGSLISSIFLVFFQYCCLETHPLLFQ